MMNVTILGTAAAEAIPAPYCECETCRFARARKGKNLRRRSAYLINQDLLVDMGPDLVYACAEQGISLSTIKYCLISHSHRDHFFPHNLILRHSMFRERGGDLPELALVAGPSVMALLNQIPHRDGDLNLRRLPFRPFEQTQLPPYRVLALQASHAPKMGDAMNYLIDDGTHRILIASDTGIYPETSFAALQDQRLDLLIMEATRGLSNTVATHLSLDGFLTMIRRMEAAGAVTDGTRIVATHFSHHHVPSHEALAAKLAHDGIECAYDGMEINL